MENQLQKRGFFSFLTLLLLGLGLIFFLSQTEVTGFSVFHGNPATSLSIVGVLFLVLGMLLFHNFLGKDILNKR